MNLKHKTGVRAPTQHQMKASKAIHAGLTLIVTLTMLAVPTSTTMHFHLSPIALARASDKADSSDNAAPDGSQGAIELNGGKAGIISQ